MAVTTLSPVVKVGLESKDVRQVVSLPSHNLLVCSCFDDSRIRVFKNDAGGKLIRLFDNHFSPKSNVHIVHLVDDVI